MKCIYPSLIAAALLFSACDRASMPASQAPPSNPPVSDVSAKAAVDLEKRLEVERTLRMKTEARLIEQEKAKSHWQSFSLLAVAGAVVLLIVGTCLGSRARHEANN